MKKSTKAAGANVVSATGMHFGLLPRLKAHGLIVTSGKTFKFKAGPEGVSVSRSKKAEKVVAKATVKKAAPRVAEKKTGAEKPAVDNQLLTACEKLLEADPFKVWTGIDLVKAIGGAGVVVPSWKGLHFSLPAILRNAKLVEKEGKGFRAAVRPASTGSSRESDSAEKPKSE